MPGFTGSLKPGDATNKSLQTPISHVNAVTFTANKMDLDNSPRCLEEETYERPPGWVALLRWTSQTGSMCLHCTEVGT